MQPFSRQHMRADQSEQRRQGRRAGPDPVGQGGDIKIDALAAIDLALPVERLVLGELGIEDHRQQVRAGPTARDRVEGRWRLGRRSKLIHHSLYKYRKGRLRTVTHSILAADLALAAHGNLKLRVRSALPCAPGDADRHGV